MNVNDKLYKGKLISESLPEYYQLGSQLNVPGDLSSCSIARNQDEVQKHHWSHFALVSSNSGKLCMLCILIAS